jgi:predicted nucleic acid-binding protein
MSRSAASGGHKQATDAYLAALAASRGGQLATLDEGLASLGLDHVVLI